MKDKKKKTKIGIYLEPKTAKTLRILAAEEEVSMSLLVEEILSNHFKRMKKIL